MKSVFVFVGLPGSLKSTYALRVAENSKDVVIINKDKIREMLYGKYAFKEEYEYIVREIAHHSMFVALINNKSCIIDETNITIKARKELIKLIRKVYHKTICPIYCTVFKASPKSLERRQKDNRGVDPKKWEEVYQSMMSEYEEPTIDEGFEYINYVDPEEFIQNN